MLHQLVKPKFALVLNITDSDIEFVYRRRSLCLYDTIEDAKKAEAECPLKNLQIIKVIIQFEDEK